jgi:hypothetical protein
MPRPTEFPRQDRQPRRHRQQSWSGGNHHHQAARQDGAIVQSDINGADTTADINSLKAYVLAHMGASTSFTLTGSYNRAVDAAKAAANASAANAQVYADAQKACGGRTDSITQARCNQDYIAKHLANLPPPGPVVEPKLADYQRNFRAPIWTPDIAGALMLGALAALGFGLVRLRRKGR